MRTPVLTHVSFRSFVFIALCGSLGLGILPSIANAAIAVTDAKIAGGKLVVTGTSDVGDVVSLDGYYTVDVTNKAFSFSLVYVPSSCVVSLGAPGTTTPNIRAVIANCAPMPVNPMGVWQADKHYQPNDLVERDKGQFIALSNPRPNVNEDPLFASSFWRAVPMQNATAEQTILVGPKGERGEAGQNGVKGDKGEDGLLANLVLHTIKADLIMPPIENGQAKGDWKVVSSGTLAVAIAKDGRDPYADLILPNTSIPSPDACLLTGTVFDGGADKKPGSLGRLKKMGDSIVLPVRITGDTTRVEALVICPKAK